MTLKENLGRYLKEEEITKLIDSMNESKVSSLILNSHKICDISLKEHFNSFEKNNYIKNSYFFNNKIDSPGKSFLFDNGLYYIMDSSSMMVSYFLNPKENTIILDMCAAPGGKTISTYLKSKNLTFISNDSSYERSLKLSTNIERLGFNNIIVTSFDFLKKDNYYDNFFDYIILDAPCSGSAMIRKNKEAKDDWSIEKVKKCSEIQKKLLNKAIDMLKVNGELIYSTCSFSYEENEEVILDILNSRKDIELIFLPHIHGEYRPNLNETIFLFPHLFKGEGQYIAKIKKIKSSSNFSLINKKLYYDFQNLINKKEVKDFLNKYNLKFNYVIKINDNYYGLDKTIPIYKDMNLIRYGINFASIKNNELIPTFNLSHYLDSSFSINLNETELKAYLHGDIIKKDDLNLKDGYYIVSYKKLNLGIVKKIKNTLKNFYPKGLRR